MALAACGGSTPTAPVSAPSTPAAVRSVLIGGAAFQLRPGTATYKNIDLPPSGMLDAVVDWAGDNDINVFVTDNVCPGFQELRAGACPVIVKADSATGKPERVSWSTTTAAGRIWTVWIYNNGARDETGTMEVGITTAETVTALPSPTPPPPAPTGGNPTSNLAPGPVARYTIKVRSIDVAGGGGQSFRDPYQNGEGQWVVHPDEFVVLDSTQKNATGELCRVQSYPPSWSIDEEGQRVLVPRVGQNNPFLLRLDVRKKGVARVYAVVDGVESNRLDIVSQTR
jgi:hypothetical protein